MTMEQLDYFIAAVENPNFFEAAEQLHTTQSSLSKQILKMERELNVTLFDRSHRSASLTTAGEAFYREALILTRQYQKMLQVMQSYKNLPEKGLTIGTLPITAQYHLDERFREFSMQNPGIPIHLEEVEESELMHGLQTGKYSFAITRSNMIDSKIHHSILLADDELVVLIPKDHPATAKDTITLTDLEHISMILMHPYTSVYRYCLSLFESMDCKPSILRTARIESIISAVSAGEAWSILPRKSYELFQHTGCIARPLTPEHHLSVNLVWLKTQRQSSVQQTFSEFFNQRVQSKKQALR